MDGQIDRICRKSTLDGQIDRICFFTLIEFVAESQPMVDGQIHDQRISVNLNTSCRHMAAAVAASAPVLSPPMWTAAREGRVEDVRQLLAEEEDIEERGGP